MGLRLHSSAESVLYPPIWNTVFQAFWAYIPDSILEYVRYIPTREYARFQYTLKVINKVSKQLIDQKSEELLAGGKTTKDVMSVLGKQHCYPAFQSC